MVELEKQVHLQKVVGAATRCQYGDGVSEDDEMFTGCKAEREVSEKEEEILPALSSHCYRIIVVQPG